MALLLPALLLFALSNSFLLFSCLVPPGFSQTTLTGNDWRYAVAYWPSMVAGLFARRHDASVAPFDSARRQSPYGTPPKRRKKTAKKRARSVSPAGTDSLAAYLAGASDCSGDEVDCELHEPVLFNAAGAMYEKAFPGMPVSDAVLEVVCRAAALTGRICGDNISPGGTMTGKEAKDLAGEARTFVTKYVAALLGTMNTSKFHRLANHLFASLVDHGNLTDGDTSVNEGLHKKCKRMYARTNKKVDDYTLQMLRAYETLSHVLDEAAKEQVEADRQEKLARGEGSVPKMATEAEIDAPPMEWTGGALHLPPNGDEDSSADEADTRRPPVIRQRLYGRRARVRDLTGSSKHGVSSELGAVLGVADEEELVVRHSMAFTPTLEWGGLLAKQRAHCTESNHGMSWYDFIRYRDPSAPKKVCFGRVLYAIYGIGDQATRVSVVQQLEEATADGACVRTRFGFTRLRWKMAGSAAVPSLAVVDVNDVLRLEQVEPDFVPLTERYGMFARPDTPTSTDKWRRRRFFVNPFHSWTSNSIADM